MTTDIQVSAIFDLIGKEDLAIGRGTFARTTSDGGSQDITKIGLHTFVPGIYVVDPLVYGNGSTDATAAIQAGIDALSIGAATPDHDDKLGFGGIVLLPTGDYKISSALEVLASNGAHNITIAGLGPLASTIKNTGVGTDAIRVIGSDGDSVHGFAMKNLTVRGTSQSGRGLYADHLIHLVNFDRVDFYNHGGGGVRIEDVSNNITFTTVRIWNDGTTPFTALDVVGLDLWSQAEQVHSYGLHVRGFGTGVRVAKYANIVGFHGGFIDQCALGLAIRASDDDFDAGVDTVLVEQIYFEENGRDIRINNEDASPENFARNVTVTHCSFSQTSGYSGPYSSGTQSAYSDSPAPHSILLGKAKGCHITGNTWRKIGTSSDGAWTTTARSLVRGSSVSEDNEISGNYITDTVGVNDEPHAIAFFEDSGVGNWGDRNIYED
jgi:hypothetical protein